MVLESKIRDYHKICELVKEFNDKIRFAGVINERGKITAGGMKEGITPLESEKDDEMLYMELALRVKMRKEFDSQLGPVRFAMALREKALAMSFPIGSNTLYVYAQPDADYKTLPEKIIEIINQNS